MGLSFVTEGAIPFAAADPLRAIPSFIVGSALTGALVGAFDIQLMAPHGGIFVVLLLSNQFCSCFSSWIECDRFWRRIHCLEKAPE